MKNSSMPCKNCESRTVHPNCHGFCKKYAEYVSGLEKYRQKKREEGIFLGYIKERSLKRR